MKVIVEADGGSRGNPGPAGYGAVVMAEDGTVLAERAESLGTATNNVAEYSGLIAGLTAARELGAAEVAVRMDSKLVVEQMKGTWQVKNAALRELAREAVALRSGFTSGHLPVDPAGPERARRPPGQPGDGRGDGYRTPAPDCSPGVGRSGARRGP